MTCFGGILAGAMPLSWTLVSRVVMAIAALSWTAPVRSAAPVAAKPAAPTAAKPAPPRVPFIAGLTTVRATATPQGDYETLRVVDSITPQGYRIVASSEVVAADSLRAVSIARRVRGQDQQGARAIRTFFHSGDPETFPGTVPGLSATMVQELRNSGRTRVLYQDIGVMFGMATVKRELAGTLQRSEGAATWPVLVNGRRIALPVIHASGLLSDGDGAESFEFHVSDDPANPILLASRGPGFSSSLVRIEYPQQKQVGSTIERDLAAGRPADVYGIYFSFARADLRPQSARVLGEIAAMLGQHPDWRLRIDGHTDGMGGEAANLMLSQRRAAAVKQALVSRHAIAPARLITGGFGESRPMESNDTPTGRARNRRVELRRQ